MNDCATVRVAHGSSLPTLGTRHSCSTPCPWLLSIFPGTWWLVGFGFNALMLVHESNQPPTNFNDSGDTSDSETTTQSMEDLEFFTFLESLPHVGSNESLEKCLVEKVGSQGRPVPWYGMPPDSRFMMKSSCLERKSSN
jgi:hypothetical protein